MTQNADAGWPADVVAEADALIADGRASSAVLKLATHIAMGKGGMRERLALVRAMLATNDPGGAAASARELCQMFPQDADAAIAFGDALLALEDLPSAIAEYQRGLRVSPTHPGARIALARAWIEVGEATQALEQIDLAQSHGADGAVVTLLRQKAEALLAMARQSPSYVRHLFDQFAPDYDARMIQLLGYAAPKILVEMARLISGGTIGKARTLDLGCGTGLAGTAFKPFATALDGIDLSPRMIEAAEALRIYDRLVVGDIEDMLDGATTYERIIAADVLVYIGDVAPTFAGVKRALSPGGQFLFTVEAKGDEDDLPFALQESKRYHHRESYLRAMAAAHGLGVRGLLKCTPRHNVGKPVPGFAVALSH